MQLSTKKRRQLAESHTHRLLALANLLDNLIGDVQLAITKDDGLAIEHQIVALRLGDGIDGGLHLVKHLLLLFAETAALIFL